MWAPRKMDLARLREVKGLEDLHNRAFARRSAPTYAPISPTCPR